jgi:Tfp pilus assembly protein PilF
LIAACYSNSFKASWHFDDYSNIVNKPALHLEKFSLNSITRTFYSRSENSSAGNEKMFRPLACLTFGLNWYVGQGRVTGYHIVNAFLHILSTYLLYLTVLALLNTPFQRERYSRNNKFWIAFLSAILWAVNPIQTQAVTYIVQRMTALAAFFYLLSIYLFLKARMSLDRKYSAILYLLCLISFIAGMASKENAAMLPFILIVIEVVFFRDLTNPRLWRWACWSAILIAIIAVAAGIFMGYFPDSVSFLGGYKMRPFSYAERMLTEPRILILYLSLIFYPTPDRLSFMHDVPISTSLLNPWTTLPAIGIIVALIMSGFYLLRRRPLIGFAVIFFLMNHVIESTIVPLELVYEHRNYLPSMFLFVPIVAGFMVLLNYYRNKQKIIFILLCFFILALIPVFGSGTYVRNMVWANEKVFWEDAMAKAPGLARPPHNLAWDYYEKNGEYEKALSLYEKALELESPFILNSKVPSLINIANIYHKKGNYKKAVAYIKEALSIDPENKKARYNLTLSLIKEERYPEALENIDILLKDDPEYLDYANLKGVILIHLGKYEDAVQFLNSGLQKYPGNTNGLYYSAIAFRALGKYRMADQRFLQTARKAPGNITVVLALIENSLKAGKFSIADQYLERIFSTFSLKEIKFGLIYLKNDNFYSNLDFSTLSLKIKEKIPGNKFQ